MTADAGGAAVTVNVAVAPVEASVIVNVPAAFPLVSVAAALVSVDTEIEPILAPVPPETVNRLAAVSPVQSVLVLVSVSACVPLATPLVTDSDNVGVATVVVAATTPVTPSVSVSVPVAPLAGDAKLEDRVALRIQRGS